MDMSRKLGVVTFPPRFGRAWRVETTHRKRVCVRLAEGGCRAG